MKILLVTQNFYPEIGSGANRFKNLYLQFAKNHTVDVLTTHPSYPNPSMYEDWKYWNEPDINDSNNIMRLKMRSDKQGSSMVSRLVYYFELSYKIRTYIKEYQQEYDAIYITTPNIFIPWASLFFQKKVKKTQRILEVRDLWPDSVKDIEKMNIDKIYPLLKFLEKQMYKKADKIVINNEGFRAHIAKMAPLKQQLFIPNGFSQEEVDFRPQPDDFKVIYTGNIGFAQSYEQLIEVAGLLESKEITFNVIGYGVNAHKFNNFIKENNYKYVHTFHEKNRSECLEMIRTHSIQLSLLKESDVFLNVLPGKVVDGIGCGIPVVTNLGGYTNRLINDYEVGFAKEKATAAEIVAAIEEIKKDDLLEKRYRENSRKLLNEKFLWEKNMNRLSQFIMK
ncbi:glycosyltransferase family 4 protein [Salinicoccus cyprini]|uniref:Glycosyltransferase family 4 protein n=1 Tax=Salinicoccus cyprini TaxID=2493691 RepID=A0A558AX91_9STAP|nr:glycosyltransferase family 4 protein [Salinicoccus cyprini]TVT28874.1 glycosyltransferase family 4 protein [Salinicoccus cyprini]